MKNLLSFAIIVISFSACSRLPTSNESKISLAGEWRFRIDTADVGIKQQWFKQKFTEKVNLPGLINTNKWNCAWYQKEITIPRGWEDKQIILTLERCHWETILWANGEAFWRENSPATPHRYYLNDLKPGKLLLSIRIDSKSPVIPGLEAYNISGNTQSNLNGIEGAITLEERPLAFISSVKITPDINQKLITVDVRIQSQIEQKHATLYLQAFNQTDSLEKKKFDINIFACENQLIYTYPMGDNPLLWDEFHPNLHALHVELQTQSGNDQTEATFGMKEWSTIGTQITLNGNPAAIRDTLESCIFPETESLPATVADWMQKIKIYKSYGLNSLRFCLWCPPEAAFVAADSLGFYFQVECDTWTHRIENGDSAGQFVMDESERIVKEYGNHPSFCRLPYKGE